MLAASPLPTKSPAAGTTIGIFVAAFFVAIAEGMLPVTMTSTLAATSSPTSVGILSGLPSAYLCSISRFLFSHNQGRAAPFGARRDWPLRAPPWQQSDPLAPPAGRRRRFLFRECRIGATMAPAPGELSDLRGRRAQHPDRNCTETPVSAVLSL
jgi:hypothetical protein